MTEMLIIWGSVSAIFLILAVYTAFSYHFVLNQNQKLLSQKEKYNSFKIDELRLESLKYELEGSKEKLHKAEVIIAEAESLEKLLVIIKKDLSEKEEDLKKIKCELSLLDKKRQELFAIEDSIKKQEERIKDLESKEEREGKKLRELQDSVHLKGLEIKGLGHEQEALQKENCKLLQEKEEQEKNLTEAYDNLNKAQTMINDLAESIKNGKEELSNLKIEISEKENKRNLLKVEIENLQKIETGLKSENNRLNAENDRLKSEINAHKIEMENLKNISESLRNDLKASGKYKAVDAAERYRDLWEPCFRDKYESLDRGVGEERQIKNALDYIKDCGLVFPERVFHAFHTALKINDISPLVVLAGISGTGKSELPRRYAEGMGIHFVNLSVQPRWDSPQDLFGFYNYMESRYKATELARAMVQFERYNIKDWEMPEGWDNSLADHVLLVLLDEMNLARVEYYFSEFLSKLEIRRGINKELSQERAKAEIILDTGSLEKETDKSLRLFPDNNIIFTGTMNEDETTQSLSDKVLDRASVLRFGRPHKTEMGGGRSSSPIEKRLPYETWKKWLVTEDKSGKDIQEWIDSLNSLMDKMQRPFGHRVAQAMSSYIRNYPSWVKGRMGLSKADLIEQKILPKLRGVDKDDHKQSLGELGKMIRECGDERLLKEFEKSCAFDSFIWRGLDRMEE